MADTPQRSIVWVRSLLSVYRQAAIESARPDMDPARRQTLLEELGRVHVLFAAHDDLDALWRSFGGIEAGVRAALRPLGEASLACDPNSPMRALIEFAAEEIAYLFEEENAG
jgi:hypothetical protein